MIRMINRYRNEVKSSEYDHSIMVILIVQETIKKAKRTDISRWINCPLVPQDFCFSHPCLTKRSKRLRNDDQYYYFNLPTPAVFLPLPCLMPGLFLSDALVTTSYSCKWNVCYSTRFILCKLDQIHVHSLKFLSNRIKRWRKFIYTYVLYFWQTEEFVQLHRSN